MRTLVAHLLHHLHGILDGGGHLHHLAHLVKLLHHAVDLHNGGARASGYTLAAA